MKLRVLIVFAMCLVSLNGCYSFRKKFIRKKKTEEAPVYVSFKDYPATPTREAYIDYYLFVRGWLDELTQSLETGDSFKRRKRAINEAIMNLEQIMSFYATSGKDAIYPLYEELLSVRREIEKNPNLGEMKRRFLIKKIEHFQRQFAINFTYDDAQKWME